MHRRDLKCELTAWLERSRQARDECVVFLNPMKCGVRHDQIVLITRVERFDRPNLEAKAWWPITASCRFEHAGGSVDADGFARLEPRVKQPRQLAGAAAQIDDAHVGRRTDHRHQIEERLLALAAEFLVLSGVPGIHSCQSEPYRFYAAQNPIEFYAD